MGAVWWNSRTRLWFSYASAVGGTAVALQLTLWMRVPAGQDPTLFLFLIPIAISTFLGGWKSGLLATFLSARTANYYLLPPLHSLVIASPYQLGKWAALVGTGALTSLLTESLDRTKKDANTITSNRLLPMERKIWWSFAGALALLAATGLVTYAELTKLRENNGLVAHTHEVIASLHLVQSLVTDAEAGLRGYLITGDSSYLRPYNDARFRLKDELARLGCSPRFRAPRALPRVLMAFRPVITNYSTGGARGYC
jgi:hypothetical protein